MKNNQQKNDILSDKSDKSFGLFIDMSNLWEQYLKITLIKNLYNKSWSLVNNEVYTYENQFFAER